MADRRTGSFGTWGSPITADAVVTAAVSLLEPRIEGDNIYWIEARPLERGRNVIIRRAADGTIGDVTPAPFDARSQVHSYGGGAYAVDQNGVYFVNYPDNQIYRQTVGGSPAKITSRPTCLYADICVDATRNRLTAIKEERPNGDVINAINTLVAVDIQTGSETVLDAAYDFYSSPALSADGSRLAWLSWRHPNMPWTATQLSVSEFGPGGGLINKHLVAGGDPESIFQPQWSPDGRLYFISDRTDFWNLYRWNGSAVEPILVRNAEFGAPQWLFGLSTYAFTSADAIIYSFTENGMWYLGRLDTRTLSASDYAVEFSSLSGVRATANTVVLRCSTSTTAPAIATVDVSTGSVSPIKYAILPTSFQEFESYFSMPQAIQFPTDDGEVAHAFYYPPNNPDWHAPSSEKPPLIVKSHGGPTACADSGLALCCSFGPAAALPFSM